MKGKRNKETVEMSMGNARNASVFDRAGRYRFRATWPSAWALASFLTPFLGGGWAQETPPPGPAYGQAAHDLPLEVYKELKEKFEGLSGGEEGARMTKEEAGKALGETAKRHHVVLIRALKAAQVLHRELSAIVLEYSSQPGEAVKALSEALLADPDPGVRRALAWSLGNLKQAEAVEALIKVVEDKVEAVRAQAAVALGRIRDNRAQKPLLELLSKDPQPLVRLRAAEALASAGDANLIQALLALLEKEKDYRVRMAIAGTVRKLRGGDAQALQGAPQAGEQIGVISEIAKEMKAVEEKLRNDRHDQAVQVEQKGIEDKLSELIKKVQQMESMAQGKAQEKERQQQQKKGDQEKPGDPSQKQPSSPLKDSTLAGRADRGALKAAEVSDVQDAWAKLPPAMREELLQIYPKDIPERWRKRLEAYYLSVAAEEAKKGE